jgi:hypothetical protein
LESRLRPCPSKIVAGRSCICCASPVPTRAAPLSRSGSRNPPDCANLGAIGRRSTEKGDAHDAFGLRVGDLRAAEPVRVDHDRAEMAARDRDSQPGPLVDRIGLLDAQKLPCDNLSRIRRAASAPISTTIVRTKTVDASTPCRQPGMRSKRDPVRGKSCTPFCRPLYQSSSKRSL